VGTVVRSEWLACAEDDISTDMLVDPTLAQFQIFCLLPFPLSADFPTHDVPPLPDA